MVNSSGTRSKENSDERESSKAHSSNRDKNGFVIINKNLSENEGKGNHVIEELGNIDDEDKFTMSRMERFLKKLDKQLEESLR